MIYNPAPIFIPSAATQNAGTTYNSSLQAPAPAPASQPTAPTAAPTQAPTTQPDTLLASNGGTAGRPAPTDAQLAPLLASLSSLTDILTNKNQNSQDEHDRAINSYNAADTLDANAHNDAVHGNEETYTGNNQAALLNAANASGGLSGVLASLHALGGSGMDVVRRLVGLAANADSGAARNTFDGNAKTIDNGWQTAVREQGQRRDDAESSLVNNKQNNEAGVLTSKQSILQQLATMFGAGTAKGDQYSADSAALSAPIAATTRASVAPYVAPSSTFSPGATQSYLAGTKNLNVTAAGPSSSTAINAPGYNPSIKKETLSGVA